MSNGASPPGAERSRSGCLIALYVIVGLGVLFLVAGGIGAWVFLQSETGQRVSRVVSAGLTLSREATQAPGTAEMRAAGCSQALVLSTQRMADLVQELAPQTDRNGRSSSPFAEDTVVLCQVTREDEAPGCGDIARVYGGSVPEPPERFGVAVQAMGRRRPLCEGSYAPDGTVLEPRARN